MPVKIGRSATDTIRGPSDTPGGWGDGDGGGGEGKKKIRIRKKIRRLIYADTCHVQRNKSCIKKIEK